MASAILVLAGNNHESAICQLTTAFEFVACVGRWPEDENLIFKAFKSPRCCTCKRKFQELEEEISSSDRNAITLGVSEGKFVCQFCKSSFHGKCGKAGQVNPSSATVKCPKCTRMQKLPLPFMVIGTKAKHETDNFFEQGAS